LEDSPENRKRMVSPAKFGCQRDPSRGVIPDGCATLDRALYCDDDRAEKAEYAKGHGGRI
jgi:hypothetical protein